MQMSKLACVIMIILLLVGMGLTWNMHQDLEHHEEEQCGE